MAIYIALAAEVTCDDCKKILAYLEFDAKDAPKIEHIQVRCPACQEKWQSLQIEAELASIKKAK